MQQLQTATTDAVSYRKNAQKILDSLKANDMELIETTLAYSLEVFQSNVPPLRKLLMLRLIKDAIVIKSAKFINKYVQNRTLLTYIGNICTHKLGDSSYERGTDLFQGQGLCYINLDPQSSCEFLRLALELVEYLAITFPKDSKGAPTKFKIQFDELKQMGVKFYPQSELMDPFDPNVQIDQPQPSQMMKPAQSQVKQVDNRKERDETMLELNKMKQTLYQDIEMISDSLQNETDMGYINDVMETYSESMQVMEVNLAKQINKASAFEGVLSEDELAELYALKDFTAQFQKYYKGYLSELCTPDAYKKMKKLILNHIQKIQNKDFDFSIVQQKQPQKQQQFMSEEEQLEMIKQQSKIEYEQHQKSQISQQQSQSYIQQKQREEQQREEQRLLQQKQEQERIQREKEEEARQAKIREEQFRQEQLRQIQIREEYERQQREEQQRKEKERLEQERLELQRQEQLLEQQRKQAQLQVQQRSQTMKQNRNYDFQEQNETPTGYESNLPNFAQTQPQSQIKQQQQQQNQKPTNNYIDSNLNVRQTSSFGKVKQDNQYEQIQSQFEQPNEGFNQFNYQNNNQQDPMNKIFSSINKIDNHFDENFDGLSQSTVTQQFFPLKMDAQIPIKEYTGKLVRYDNTQFQLLHKFRLSDSQQKRFKIASLKGKAALVNSAQLQIGVKQSLQYVPLKEKNYLKLTLYIGNKTQSPFDNCRMIFEGDNKSFQIWLKPDKIQEKIEPGKQISQEIIGNFRQYENYKLINAIFQGQWANKQISTNFCIPTTLVSFMDFKDVSLQIFRAQWRGKKRQILKSETFLLNPKIIKTAYHLKKIFPKLSEFRPYQQFQHQQFEYFNDRQQQYITYKLGGIFELTNVNQNYMIKFIVLPNMYCTLQIIGANEQLCKQMLNTLNWMLGLE